jgi:type IV pilus assembly protein PilX
MATVKREKGLVLFIALIALVAMSLAAVALIRSVDTNSLIIGNLSYRQTAVISSSYGIESMADNLGPRAVSFGEATNAAIGYYAVCTAFDSTGNRCGGANLTANASWQPGTRSAIAGGVGLQSGIDAYGNTIEYIVERMCTSVGPPTAANCLMATVNPEGSTKGDVNAPLAGGPTILTDAPLYRVTVRITGPKNTISYVQTFIS